MSKYNIKQGFKKDQFFVIEPNPIKSKGGEHKLYFIKWIGYSIAKCEAWIEAKMKA